MLRFLFRAALRAISKLQSVSVGYLLPLVDSPSGFRLRRPRKKAFNGSRQRRTKRKSEQSVSLSRVALLRNGIMKHNLDDTRESNKAAA